MIFSNGGPPITGDNANQWVQTWDTVADLRGQIGTATSFGVPQAVYLQGFQAPGDGGQGSFYWNGNSTAPDDGGATTVVPSGSVQGAWIRIRPSSLTATNAGVNSGPSTSFTNLCSITFAAPGLWISTGGFFIEVPSGTTLTAFTGGLSTSATSLTGNGTSLGASLPGPTTITLPVPTQVTIETAGTTYFLVLQVVFTGVGPCIVGGGIQAALL